MKKLVFLLYILTVCLSSATQAQVSLNHQYLEQVKKQPPFYRYHVVWLGDTILVRKKDGTRKDFPKLNIKDSTQYKLFCKRSLEADSLFAQNCLSYAFETYFKFDKKHNQSLFNFKTSIFPDDTERLLKNHFKKISEFPTKPIRNFKKPLPDHAIIVFVHNSAHCYHMAYCNNGIVYSKNGACKATTYKRLKDLYKNHYWDVTKIEFYRYKE